MDEQRIEFLRQASMGSRAITRGTASDRAPRRSVSSLAGSLSGPDDLLKIMWRGRWILLLCVGLALGAGTIYLRVAVPMYESRAKLYVQQGIPSVLRLDSVAPQRYNLYTQAALLSSTGILTRALERVDVAHLKTFAGQDSALARLERNLDVSIGKNDDVITVSFSCPYPLEAAEIVNAVVNAFMADYEENRRRTSTEILDSLNKQIELADQQVAKKRRELADLKKTMLFVPDANGAVMGDPELPNLAATLRQAQIERIDAETFRQGVVNCAKDPASLREYVEYLRGRGSPDTTASLRVSLAARLFELRLKRRELLNGEFTVNHPRVASIDDEIQQIETRLSELDGEFVAMQIAAAEQRYWAAARKEGEIVQLYETQRQQAAQLNEKQADYEVLDSEIQELAEWLKNLRADYRNATWREDAEIEPLKIRVMEYADTPSVPSWPKKNRVLAVALLIGIFTGGAVAVLRDWLDQTLRSADEVSALLGLSVLGVIPGMSRRELPQTRGQKVHLQRNSREAEAFRTVRTAIFFGAAKENAKTLLVTSPDPGDGKSTLVSNLGIAIAQTGQKTLILDADLRKPMQHILFNANHSDAGIREVLAGRVRLRDAIRPTSIKGLSLLACGQAIPNSAEILNSARFAKLLQYLGQVYNWILIDSPPVTVVTDAQIIAAVCDWAILVVRTGKSTRKMSQRAIHAMEGVGAHMLGVVVNDVHKEGSHYGYYGAGRGYYGSNGNRRKSLHAAETPSVATVKTSQEGCACC